MSEIEHEANVDAAGESVDPDGARRQGNEGVDAPQGRPSGDDIPLPEERDDGVEEDTASGGAPEPA